MNYYVNIVGYHRLKLKKIKTKIMKLEEWKTLSQEEKQKFWENEKNKLEAEKLKLAEAMELAKED